MVIDIGVMEGETTMREKKEHIVSSNLIERRKKWVYRHYRLLMYSVRTFDALDPIIQIFFLLCFTPAPLLISAQFTFVVVGC